MKWYNVYEKLNAIVTLELFDHSESRKQLVNDFSPEFSYLNNMSNELFSNEPTAEQFGILRIYDVYFRNGAPLITDNEYDGLLKIYESAAENPNNIMFEPTLNAWEKVVHDIPMGSLDKQTDIDDIEKWNAKKGIVGTETLISEKLDGISLEAIYHKGKFVQAITRGDGHVGDDITENARYFDGILPTLDVSWDCSIRGEVMLTKNKLHSVNTLLMAKGKEPYKNTRNGVSGVATKFKDRDEAILSLISFVAFDVQIFDVNDEVTE